MRTPVPVLVAALAVLALAGCAPDAPVVIPDPEPSSAPIFESDEEALAAAEVAYGEYLKVSDAILADGGRNPERIKKVATAKQAEIEIDSAQETLENGTRGIGISSFDRMTLQQFDPSTKRGVVSAYACVDFSMSDIVDATGKSVVPPGRPDVIPVELLFDEGEKRTLLVSNLDVWSGEDFCAE